MHSILVYHTINHTDGQSDCPEMISPARFEQQVRWLSRRKRVVSLIDTLTLSQKQNVVAITFDDGYRDNLTVALPILEKYGLPLTLFVVAGFVDRDGYLSATELREMSQHPSVTIGSHGLGHRHFTRLTKEEAQFELMQSRRVLEDIIAAPVDLLAWPYGECSPELEKLSAEAGYRASWSVWKGSNAAHSRWRVPLGNRDNLPRFIAKASGLYGLTEARWHRFKMGRQRENPHAAAGRALAGTDEKQELRSAI